MSEDKPTKRSGRDELGMRPAPPPRGDSWFLGIGIDAYQDFSPLSNAVRDVQAVSEVLIQEYDVEEERCVLLLDEAATRKGILRAIRAMAKNVKSTDKLIIYYSGHGHLNEFERGFWVPVSAGKDDEEDYVSNARLRDLISDIPAKHTLVISDACFSGALFIRGANRSADLVAEELERRPSRWAICSGRHDEEVIDGPPGGHSPFAMGIIKELQRNTRSVLRVSSLVDRVVEITRASYEQLPEGNPLRVDGHEGGQYVFRRKNTEAAVWEDSLSKATLAGFLAYLDAYPNGQYADQAHEHIAVLEDEQAWREAKRINTFTSYRDYQQRFRQGAFLAEAKQAVIDLRIKSTYHDLLKSGDEKAIERFLSENPDSVYAGSLQDQLGELQQEAVQQKKKTEAADTAKAKADEEKRLATEKAKREKQKLEDQQKRQAEIQAQRQQQEEKHWKTVKDMHSLDAYRDFLRQHPHGRYATQAKTAVQELKPAFPWRKIGIPVGAGLLLLLVVLLWRPWAGGGSASFDPQIWEFKGKVIIDGDNPLPLGGVEISSLSTPVITATTAEDGTFLFELPYQRYTLGKVGDTPTYLPADNGVMGSSLVKKLKFELKKVGYESVTTTFTYDIIIGGDNEQGISRELAVINPIAMKPQNSGLIYDNPTPAEVNSILDKDLTLEPARQPTDNTDPKVRYSMRAAKEAEMQKIGQALEFSTAKGTFKDNTQAEKLLSLVKDFLATYPELKIEIGGHTDSVGSSNANKKLSEMRAEAVYRILLEMGVNEDQLSYKGYGEEKPLAENKTANGRSQNRRIEFKVLE